MEQTVVQVKGLHCSGCVARLEQALDRAEGIRRSEIDFRHQTVDVAYDPESIGQPAISSLIQDAGFEVVSWTQR